MPFGPYKNYEDCIKKTMKKKGWGRKRASAYCAVIERTIRKEMNKWEKINI